MFIAGKIMIAVTGCRARVVQVVQAHCQHVTTRFQVRGYIKRKTGVLAIMGAGGLPVYKYFCFAEGPFNSINTRRDARQQYFYIPALSAVPGVTAGNLEIRNTEIVG
jgi:hypothetical protein